jgi:hypothetical protein
MSAPLALIRSSCSRRTRETLGNRFLLSAIACQRCKPLQYGATALVAQDGHLANTISWSRAWSAAPTRRDLAAL